jgi:hypothetical protein
MSIRASGLWGTGLTLAQPEAAAIDGHQLAGEWRRIAETLT